MDVFSNEHKVLPARALWGGLLFLSVAAGFSLHPALAVCDPAWQSPWGCGCLVACCHGVMTSTYDAVYQDSLNKGYSELGAVNQASMASTHDYLNCVTGALTAGGARIVWAPGQGNPSTVVYQFENDRPEPQQIVLTIWNGNADGDHRLDAGTVRWNGVVVADGALIQPGSDGG